MELKEIIARCKKGERKAQEAFYRQFADKLYGACLAYAGDRELAKDILHDAFIKAFKAIKTVDDSKNIGAWLRRIVVNTALDKLRRKAKLRIVHLDDSVEPVHVQAASPIEELQMQDLLKIVQSLPDGARTVFNLYTLEGYNHREIAEQLGVTEGTVRSQYARARAILKTLVRSHMLI